VEAAYNYSFLPADLSAEILMKAGIQTYPQRAVIHTFPQVLHSLSKKFLSLKILRVLFI